LDGVYGRQYVLVFSRRADAAGSFDDTAKRTRYEMGKVVGGGKSMEPFTMFRDRRLGIVEGMSIRGMK
jgi:hypothetical protein